jgi:hypothetical protein
MKSTIYMVFGHPPSLPGLTVVPQDRGTTFTANTLMKVQPPVIGASLRDAVNRLAHEARVSTTSQPPQHAVDCSIADNYVTQIMNWSQRLTPAQLGRRYLIEEVMALAGLKGRYREHASVRYTGEALRRCGFVAKRDWTTAGRNKRFWVKA